LLVFMALACVETSNSGVLLRTENRQLRTEF
jgi:hypothetical protein